MEMSRSSTANWADCEDGEAGCARRESFRNRLLREGWPAAINQRLMKLHQGYQSLAGYSRAGLKSEGRSL